MMERKNKIFNVSIVALNSKYIHSALAIYYLKAGIEKYANKNIEAKLYEYTIHQADDLIIEEILKDEVDLLAFSTYIWNIQKVYALAKKIKVLRPELLICLGGPEVSYNQAEILNKHLEIDFISSGDGEYPFSKLCDYLYYQKDLKEVEGLSFRFDDGLYINEPYIELNDALDPYSDEYLKNIKGRIAYFESTRGCPYNCDFCLSGRCGKVRYFDLDESFKRLDKLANSGVKIIKFVDRTFNANKTRAKKIINYIIENDAKKWSNDITFHFEIAGDILDDETIKLLQDARCGLFQLEIGMQSFYEKTLAYINRKTNTTVLKSNIKKLLLKQNMHIHIDLIIGLAYEDMKHLKESFNTAYKLKVHMLQLGFLKILHGAEYENSEKYNLKYASEPPYEVIETPWLSKTEIANLHHLEDALERINNSGRFLKTIDYIVNSSGLTPFDIFLEFGIFSANKVDYKISLDDYTDLIYNFFKDYRGIDKSILRDMMVCDRLATINTGRLAPSLYVKDKALKHYRLALEKIDKSKKGLKRGLEILYSTNEIVYVDYENKNIITNQYPLKIIKIDDIKNYL